VCKVFEKETLWVDWRLELLHALKADGFEPGDGLSSICAFGGEFSLRKI
jgi:hypothetical protein